MAKSKKKRHPVFPPYLCGICIFVIYTTTMKKVIFHLVCLASFTLSYSQNYRSAANSQYWKNRKPFEGYWQQDVHYNIKAKINEKTDVVSATEELTYYNNSPDTLTFVYFHLYQNAFQPGSYFDKLTRANNVTPKYGHYEAQKKNEEIVSMTSNGVTLKKEEDNTILKVYWQSRCSRMIP